MLILKFKIKKKALFFSVLKNLYRWTTGLTGWGGKGGGFGPPRVLDDVSLLIGSHALCLHSLPPVTCITWAGTKFL